MLNQRFGDGSSVFGCMLDNVQDTVWKTSFAEDSPNDAERAGRDFGGFENYCVACRKCVCARAESEDECCIPRSVVSVIF